MAKLVSDILAELKEVQSQFDETQSVESIDNCIRSYMELLNDAPDNPEILFQLGTALLQLRKFGAAMPFFDRCVDFWPNDPNVWSNYGCCLRALYKIDRAKAAFRKSLMSEQKADTLSNLASCYVNEDDPESGIPHAQKALEVDEDNVRARWNLSLLSLEMSDWKNGYTLYDTGFLCNERTMRNYQKEGETPWWEGAEPVEDKRPRVVFFDEQGLGDRILAAAQLHKIQDRCTPIIETHPRLENLYKRSFPWAEVHGTTKEEYLEWPEQSPPEYKYPMMSLPKYFGVENSQPYLEPDPELVTHYRGVFSRLGKGPVITFAWRGGVLKTAAGYRSIKLGWLEDLIKTVGGTWVSLQYNDDAQEKVNRFREDTGLPVYHCHGAQEYDYDHTVAAVAASDHLVTVCNTLGHTGAALGHPTTILVPKHRAWRYPRGGTFPWYPDTARMIYQEALNEWEPVLQRLKEDLSDALSHSGARSLAAAGDSGG